MEHYCELYETLEEAQKNCQCDCESPSEASQTYYHCNYGICCGHHCEACGKFESIS